MRTSSSVGVGSWTTGCPIWPGTDENRRPKPTDEMLARDPFVGPAQAFSCPARFLTNLSAFLEARLESWRPIYFRHGVTSTVCWSGSGAWKGVWQTPAACKRV